MQPPYFSAHAISRANLYALVILNDATMYQKINDWYGKLDDVADAFAPPSEGLHQTFPYRSADTDEEYFCYFNQLSPQERKTFHNLCRRTLWQRTAKDHNYSPYLPGSVIHRADAHVPHPPSPPLPPIEYGNNPCKEVLLPNSSNPIPKKRDTQMNNALPKYQKDAEATVTLIHGKPVEDYSEDELIDLVRFAENKRSQIKDVAKYSKRMAAKRKQYKADIAVYVAALDALED